MGNFVDMRDWVMREHGVPDSKLTVVEYIGRNKHSNPLWRCKCECGNEIIAIGYRIRSGRIKSCGCMRAVPTYRHGDGYKRPRLYNIWCGMKSRCYCKNAKYYKDYGAKGIVVCDEWKNDYSKFKEWALSHGYSDELTIDRIDNAKNYEPSNCRWATMKEQENNSSHNVVIEYNGEKMTLHQWSEKLNVNYDTLRARLCKRGWSIERAFTTPVRKSC